MLARTSTAPDLCRGGRARSTDSELNLDLEASAEAFEIASEGASVFGRWRQKRISEEEETILREIAAKLSADYPKLQDQLSLVRGRMKNPVTGAGWLFLYDDPEELSNYGEPQLEISGIGTVDHPFVTISILIVDGLWAGYDSSEPLAKLKAGSIDASRIAVDTTHMELSTALVTFYESAGPTVSEQLDPVSTSTEFDIDGTTYETIKTDGAGNFLAVDQDGNVYALFHDPYEIRHLFESAALLRDAVESGSFDLSNFSDI